MPLGKDFLFPPNQVAEIVHSPVFSRWTELRGYGFKAAPTYRPSASQCPGVTILWRNLSHTGDSPRREDATARVSGRVLVFPGLVMWMTNVSLYSALSWGSFRQRQSKKESLAFYSAPDWTTVHQIDVRNAFLVPDNFNLGWVYWNATPTVN